MAAKSKKSSTGKAITKATTIAKKTGGKVMKKAKQVLGGIAEATVGAVKGAARVVAPKQNGKKRSKKTK